MSKKPTKKTKAAPAKAKPKAAAAPVPRPAKAKPKAEQPKARELIQQPMLAVEQGRDRAPMVVAYASQKGGVYKSTIARLTAVIATIDGLRVRIGDLDHEQQTVTRWMAKRFQNGIEPTFEVVPYKDARTAVAGSGNVHLMILDAPGNIQGLDRIAEECDLFIQPTGPSEDDMLPAVIVFHNLVRKGVPREKLVFVLSGILTKAEAKYARQYLNQAGYDVLENFVPAKASLREAQNTGFSIVEIAGKYQDLRERVILLSDEIAERIQSRMA